jgi:glycosyltransferase involved in cell wall biosynthesis
MFSVVLCTYNRADLIIDAVGRVLDQSWPDFELIVVDDGSTDQTAERLATVDDPRLRVIHRENGGLSAARNTGIYEASARLVVLLDDDDEVAPDWLSGLASQVGDTTGFVACSCYLAFPDGTRKYLKPEGNAVSPDIKGVFIAGTFAIDGDVLRDVGGYAEDIRVSHQTEMLLRALPEMKRRNLTAALTERPLITIERRSQGDRPLSQPADLLHGAEYLLDRHGEQLALCREAIANYHAIAGVSAAQLGKRDRARHHFFRAARVEFWKPKHLVRLVVSMLPAFARRAWRQPTPTS